MSNPFYRRWMVPALFFFSPMTLAQTPAAPVVVAAAQQAEVVQVVQLTGTVTAQRDARLSVAVAGLVESLAVDAGDHVETGEAILQLDAELAEQQYRAAEAAHARARHAMEDAQRRLAEARRLAPQQSIAETAVRDLESEVAEDEAELSRLRAELAYRKGVLDRHTVRAPFSGVIGARSVELGEWVAPGAAVMSLVSTEDLRLDFQVPEDYLGRVAKGNKVQFNLGADKENAYPGTVIAAVPVTDPTARTFLVRVVPTGEISGLLPGMSANVTLRLGDGQKGTAVPRDAILRYPDGRVIVWEAVSENGALVARERLVQPGFDFDGLIEIRSGLDENARVVVEGNETLRNGQALDARASGAR
ncbi:efflux RND transporter periplasmic adaptor subunit [Halioglobus maricola]|uniref:Efflux RND transporter periplasmic adaptor subunit n=1 Tax=Halioglobus maricola TaxID=2601894 RepID=A0A5P9NIE9_9GAMM|nr:efflux RND transporter periplasmic adaptor subunit [Halioglobus maricola]QFU75603.1 efflux RND transporter periplasmic adaptor subunit [Halioglobus maricola]